MNVETPLWEEAGYSDIAAATGAGDDLEVTFANGDVVHLAPATLGVTGDWEVEFDAECPVSVRVTSREGADKEVSWEQIRSLGDPNFALEMRRRDAEESRRIGLRLRALREDRNISQRDLATVVGMSPPQLSKIETGNFDLRVSTVQTLLRAMNASFSDIAGPDAPEISQRTLRQRAVKAGVATEVMDRLFTHFERTSVPIALERLLGWTSEMLRLEVPPIAPPRAAIAFKGADPAAAQRSAQVTLAFEVSKIVVQSMRDLPWFEARLDPDAIRRVAAEKTGEVTLRSLLSWTLDAGIAVIPLFGRGTFSAAVWQVEDRPCIVLKETREHAAFWLFDLAHELGHLAGGHVATEGVVDIDDLKPVQNPDVHEQQANDFALRLLLGDPEALLDQVRSQTRGSYLRFKGAVATVAEQAHVNVGLLGMVAAYELNDIGQPKDRWGSATNLARGDGLGREIAQAILLEHVDLTRVPDLDVIVLRTTVGL